MKTVSGIVVVALLILSGCSSDQKPSDSAGCPVLEGMSWVPKLPDAANFNQRSDTSVVRDIFIASAPLIGKGEDLNLSQAVTFQFTVPESIGASGSVSMIAETQEFPKGLLGGGISCSCFT